MFITPKPDGSYNKYASLLVLGDSITTGYGLANYTVGGTPYNCASYGNRLAKALELKSGETYINKAVNGDKTGDLLALLPSVKSYVEKSELIVISIGGNNLLGNLAVVASAISGQQITSLQQAAIAIQTATEADYARAMQDSTVTATLTAAVASCGTDIAAICKLIKEYNPNARTVFLKQYNPAKDVDTVKAFGTVAESLINLINAQIDAAVAAAGTGFETADVPSVINDAAAAKTNILQLDIHPNAAGHGEIYKLLLNQLNIKDPDAVVETTECVHEWGEWAEISAESIGDIAVFERVCSKCKTTERKEEQKPETTAEQTTAEVTTAVTTAEQSSENADSTTENNTGKGCKSAVSAFGIIALIAGFALVKKEKDN